MCDPEQDQVGYGDATAEQQLNQDKSAIAEHVGAEAVDAAVVLEPVVDPVTQFITDRDTKAHSKWDFAPIFGKPTDIGRIQ